MIFGGNGFGEGAGVRYPIPEDYWNPDAGGGPVSRTPLVAAAGHAGNTVYRSPLAIVPDAGPGGASDWARLHNKMMLPDGRLVDRDAMVNRPYEPMPWSTPLDAMAGAVPAQGSSGATVALLGIGALLLGAAGGVLFVRAARR